MMIMMEDKQVLIDTNVLVYSTIETSPFLEYSQSAIKQFLDNDYTLWVSRQIIREYLVVKSRLMLENNCYDEIQLLKELTYLQNNYKIANEENITTFILSDLIKKYKIAGK